MTCVTTAVPGRGREPRAPDGGSSRRTVGTGSYPTVDCAPDFGCWASGEKGRVACLEL
ncbi:hypothetical protein GCM10010446_56680 [Streptomyces enissocaesilis]|uniref:Uncharacterized protein n=1 Tax=Streptomyces enissocaesilis TaxID=332589 RepID=A0ABN3XKI6_9ACTN